ncbi:serine-type endopeptidase activity [Nesidiocoris tenuis]|uniref:Serine-type endopeptidase activity n=1 Tax=Nesidiocoris tenuis TaxID=355587 RepID=A0ABN7AFB5_9HEMI|nr:serine-type endopeptidase activity [Nesidiocoris tenuis]
MLSPSRIYGFLTILPLVCPSAALSAPASPCPAIFDYALDRNYVWIGRLRVSGRQVALPVVTRVYLALSVALQSRYVGLLELTDPVELAIDRIYRGADRINYTIRFPLPYPIPALTAVVVNNVTICYNKRPTLSLVTTILLEHTFPTNPAYLDGRSQTSLYEEPHDVCGRAGRSADPMRLAGFGEWPWLAAVLLERDRGLEFHCTGNLLTEKHVITAAHCVKTRSGRQYAPRKFVVYLGKYDLSKWDEPNSQIRTVENVVIHPDYLKRTYTADLAIMVLEEPAVFDYFVRPVCLWREGGSLGPYVGRLGAVAGWDREPAGRQSLNARPRLFYLPLVDQEECLRSHRDYFYVTSGDTFCAGLRNGTGPCYGDSGSGFVLPMATMDNDVVPATSVADDFAVDRMSVVWFLRGIVSLSLLDPYRQTCDLTNYLVFTDVAKFTDWIADTIENTF